MTSTELLLLALSALIALTIAALYAYRTVGQSRNTGLVRAFVALIFLLLWGLAAVNYHADRQIQERAHRMLCRQQLEQLSALLLLARRLHEGQLPPSLEALDELPDFRPGLIRSPVDGRVYSYQLAEDRLAAVIDGDHGKGGRNRLTVNVRPGEVTTRIEWLPPD